MTLHNKLYSAASLCCAVSSLFFAPISYAADVTPAQSTAPAEVDLVPAGKITPMNESDVDASEDDHVNIEDIDFNTIESLGIADQSRGDVLGKQFLSNSRRSAIASLIVGMPNSNWTVMQDLTNEVLLTASNTAALDNDAPVDFKAGKDLLTLRVDKLLQRGLNGEAYSLYTRMNVDPYNETIARLGALSMLLNAEKPLACVEMMTIDAPFKTETFWKELDSFCILSLSTEKLPQKEAVIAASSHEVLKKIANDKTFRFPYTPKTFGELSLFEKALLIGENRLDVSGLSEEAYKFIPSDHIQALLNLPDLDNKTKILLSARGLSTGVISPSNFAKLYTKIGRKAEKEKKTLTGLEHISTLYWKHADTFLPESRQATLQEIFGYAKQSGAVLLVPFLGDIYEITPTDSFSLDQMEYILQANLLSDMEIPAALLDRFKTVSAPTPADQKRKEKLLIAAALMSADTGANVESLKEIYAGMEKTQNTALKSMKNIIENVDNRTGSYAKVPEVYEKDFDSRTNKGYIRPSAALLDQLAQSSKGHATGETVLLCNLILQGLEQKSANAVVLGGIAKALSEIGLGKEAQRLLAEAVLSTEN